LPRFITRGEEREGEERARGVDWLKRLRKESSSGIAAGNDEGADLRGKGRVIL